MGHETRQNLIAANHLFHQAQNLRLGYGCVEVCLTALGARDIHLVDIIDENPSDTCDLMDLILRFGFIPGWFIIAWPNISERDICNILNDEIPVVGKRPKGRFAGILGLIRSNRMNWDDRDHVIAVLPHDQLPRNKRRELKKNGKYLTVDTSAGGLIEVTPSGITNYVNSVVSSGGAFAFMKLHQ